MFFFCTVVRTAEDLGRSERTGTIDKSAVLASFIFIDSGFFARWPHRSARWHSNETNAEEFQMQIRNKIASNTFSIYQSVLNVFTCSIETEDA